MSASDNSKNGADILVALKNAFLTTLVAALLAFPIYAYVLVQMNGKAALDTRWYLTLLFLVAVFFSRLALNLTIWKSVKVKSPTSTPASKPEIETTTSSLNISTILAPVLLVLSVVLPFAPFMDTHLIGILSLILIYVMLGWGLNIVVGLAGLLDLGYVAFYAVGAYSCALLYQHFGFSFWLCLPLAGILAAFWGIILGFPVLRLRGDYLAIVTLAFGEIINIILKNWYQVTGGPNGLSKIPTPTFFGLEFKAFGDHTFASFFNIAHDPLYKHIFLYYVILLLALTTNYVTLRLRRLPVGRAWEALREDEIACRSLGINTTNTKLTAFALGAMFGGFAGVLFAARQETLISPESFTFIESALILAIVVLGGRGSQLGIVFSAIFITSLEGLLRKLDFLKALFGNDFHPSIYRMLIVGIAMVLIMLWRPQGFVSSRTPTIALNKKKAISGDLVKEGHG